MIYIITVIFSFIVPYLICSINPAIIASKIKSGKDIREMGSGNPGLTNTLRTMGKGAAVVVLLLDILKGVISVLAVLFFYRAFESEILMCFNPAKKFVFNEFIEYKSQYFFLWISAFAAVIGHCFPLYYKFRGGKAVLVTVATGLVINWLAAALALCIFIMIVALSRYVSLGSICAAILYPVFVYFYAASNADGNIGAIFSGLISLLLIVKHKENIKRLINKTEKKFGKSEA